MADLSQIEANLAYLAKYAGELSILTAGGTYNDSLANLAYVGYVEKATC